jgi:4-amino-4-deoxy-L-arabinose transferase-like glycosyltransferase
LAALTALRLAVAAATPLAPDEAYYWVWSRALAPGFLDHPPMVALWVRLGTAIAGEGTLGVRLLAPLATAAGSLLLVQAGRDLFGDRASGVRAAGLLNATLLFGAGGVMMTPDTPLLFFWTATLWALARLWASGNGAWWLVAGLAAGLALDSKYTAFLLAPAVLLWVLWVPGLHLWFRRVQPAGGALLALALFAPVLVWNARHGWASFVRQGGRVGDWEPARAARFMGELLAGQIGLATPLLAMLFGAGIGRAVRGAMRREPVWSLLAALTVVPAAVFVQHALGDRVQANWPAVLYPAAALAAAPLLRRWQAPAMALGFALTALVYVQASLAPLRLPTRLDPTLAQLGGWPELAAEIARVAAREEAGFVAADAYGTAAELARALAPGLPVIGVDPRWAHFNLPGADSTIATRRGLLLRPAGRGEAGWPGARPLGALTRGRGGLVAARYSLYLVSGPPAVPAVVLPRPR